MFRQLEFQECDHNRSRARRVHSASADSLSVRIGSNFSFVDCLALSISMMKTASSSNAFAIDAIQLEERKAIQFDGNVIAGHECRISA
jgi:hypothetical protein